MAKVRVKMNTPGSIAVLNSPGVTADVARRAQAVAANANSQLTTFGGGSFVADVQAGKTRARASVVARGPYPRNHNARYNTLLKSLGAGG